MVSCLYTFGIQQQHSQADCSIGATDFSARRQIFSQLRHRPELCCNARQLAIGQLQAQQSAAQPMYLSVALCLVAGNMLTGSVALMPYAELC